MLLEGLFVPLTTPFSRDGRLDVRKLRQNVAHYSLTPAAGMVVLGASGEAELLSDAEAREVMAAAIDAAAETKVMIAGVTLASVRGTAARIDEAAAMGYDAVLVERPVQQGLEAASRLRAAEVRLYFQAVADQATLPVVVAGDIELELMVELAGHGNVLGCVRDFTSEGDTGVLRGRTVGVKRMVTVTQVFAAVTGRMVTREAGAGLVSAASLGGATAVGGSSAVAVGTGKAALKTRTKEVGFQVLAGRTERMLTGLHAGAVGAMAPFAAAAPQGCYEVYAAWKDGDGGLAAEKQERLVEAVRLIEEGLGVAGIKYGCDLNGYAGLGMRLPRLGLTEEERVEVERVMAGLKS